jgi:hypothetical protein
MLYRLPCGDLVELLAIDLIIDGSCSCCRHVSINLLLLVGTVTHVPQADASYQPVALVSSLAIDASQLSIYLKSLLLVIVNFLLTISLGAPTIYLLDKRLLLMCACCSMGRSALTISCGHRYGLYTGSFARKDNFNTVLETW